MDETREYDPAKRCVIVRKPGRTISIYDVDEFSKEVPPPAPLPPPSFDIGAYNTWALMNNHDLIMNDGNVLRITQPAKEVSEDE